MRRAVLEVRKVDEEASVFVKTYLKCFCAKLAHPDHANHTLGSNRRDSFCLKSLHRSPS
jgi:hypothetical protein